MGTSEAMLVHSKKRKKTNNPLLLQKLNFQTKHLLQTDNRHASYV